MPSNTSYTAAVIVTRSGTGWSVDVTAANLDDTLNTKDFVVLFGGVVQPNNLFNKTTPTNIVYTGTSIASTTVEVRRRTQVNPYALVRYQDRFSSSRWNSEMYRIARWQAESELFGLGSVGNITGVPRNDAYGSLWSSDTLYAPTRKALWDKFEAVSFDYQIADANLTTLINTKANTNNAALTGTPTAPTPPGTDLSTRVQTTQGVSDYLAGTLTKTIQNTNLTGSVTCPTVSDVNDVTTKVVNTTFLTDTLFNRPWSSITLNSGFSSVFTSDYGTVAVKRVGRDLVACRGVIGNTSVLTAGTPNTIGAVPSAFIPTLSVENLVFCGNTGGIARLIIRSGTGNVDIIPVGSNLPASSFTLFTHMYHRNS